MKTSHLPSSELAAERFARRLTVRLTEGTSELPYDITERLRAARVQALSKRKITVPVHQTAPAVVRSGSSAALGWGGEAGNWWRSLLGAVPVLALVAGLVVINFSQDEYGTNEVAEVDAALLTDDLPPAAYADPGFAQFLKTGAAQNN
ncbi:MAG: DUF3619 family protein [Simplicispira sp.]|nr:DUF3619 family protein [Simplicispira sp.]